MVITGAAGGIGRGLAQSFAAAGATLELLDRDADALARLDTGEAVYCHCPERCGQRIDPRAWDLGHDHEHGGYLGPETRACNRREGGRRGRASQL